MEDKCDHPAELLGTVDAESSLLSQSEDAVSEPLETADVNGATEHDGSSDTGHAEQTDDGKLVAVYGLIYPDKILTFYQLDEEVEPDGLLY
jgi:hypothetical protein